MNWIYIRQHVCILPKCSATNSNDDIICLPLNCRHNLIVSQRHTCKIVRAAVVFYFDAVLFKKFIIHDCIFCWDVLSFPTVVFAWSTHTRLLIWNFSWEKNFQISISKLFNPSYCVRSFAGCIVLRLAAEEIK